MYHLRIKILDFQPFENDWLDAEFVVLFEYELRNLAFVSVGEYEHHFCSFLSCAMAW
jgi:hypothetical protein